MPVRIARFGCGRRRGLLGARGHRSFRDTEVCESRATPRVKKNVAGLQIPMHDSILMRMFERLRNLEQDGDDLQEAGATQASKITARGKLHRQDH